MYNLEVYPIGLVPYDGVPDKVIVSIHPALTAVFIVLASVGITFAVACLIFNFICRKSKLVSCKGYMHYM